MTHVTIIHVGSLKEKYYAEACAEYEKRLGTFAKVTNIEIKEKKLPCEPNEAEINSAMLDEGERIIAYIPKKAFIITMCVEGQMLSSEDLAKKLEGSSLEYPEICFIIGSSHGLCDKVKKLSHLKLSVSKMTFPHRLMRVILLEQIYRAYTIINGTKYHK